MLATPLATPSTTSQPSLFLIFPVQNLSCTATVPPLRAHSASKLGAAPFGGPGLPGLRGFTDQPWEFGLSKRLNKLTSKWSKPVQDLIEQQLREKVQINKVLQENYRGNETITARHFFTRETHCRIHTLHYFSKFPWWLNDKLTRKGTGEEESEA